MTQARLLAAGLTLAITWCSAGSAHAQASLFAEDAEAAPADGADALPSPARAAEDAARALANLEISEAALARDRGGSDYEQMIAVTLFIGGVALSIASVSLLVGIVMEAVCVNGIIDECVDGAAYFSAALPTAVGAATLLYGATLMQSSVDRRHRELDERARELEERRDTLERQVGLALGPGSFQLRVSF